MDKPTQNTYHTLIDGTKVYWDWHELGALLSEALLKRTHPTDFWKHVEHACVVDKITVRNVHEQDQYTNPLSYQIGGDHYKNLSIEPWSAMRSWLSPQEYIGFLRGNIIKYHARARSKDSFDTNIAKAAHYTHELETFLKEYQNTEPAPHI